MRRCEMNLVWDPIYAVNLILCIATLILGVAGYRRSRSVVPLYIGIAFGLFGLSHLATLLGLKDALELVLVVVRAVAYLIVAFALYPVAFGKK
jgi:uncharacterized membrane protein (UPF0136 family)